ncbi:LPO_1073/Vpar_1526 family protein [Streptomyces sp. CRN 30]|uniref:LPO_1073/Vpar_1526 family protein n=1 Tax=Streptomyces sp. CRN 30 TaxID=3075613 RepID=UPI002A82D0D9|nr:LPO_1073/Vpar_1526 family protein [Streptomyces sp. CRN 30]
MTTKQNQRGGDGSTNIQGESIKYIEVAHYGVSVADAKTIAMDVFEMNVTRFTEIARQVASERVGEFTNKLLGSIPPQSLAALQDPDVQRRLFFAQQEFACSGDDEIGDTLITLLAERITNSRHGMRRLVLNEALQIAAKLTADHISLLTCNFFLKYVSFGDDLRTVQEVAEEVDAALTPYRDEIFNLGQPDLDYLRGNGCLTVNGGFIQASVSPGQYLGWHYPGIFTQGFTLEEFYDGHHLVGTPLIEEYPTADGNRYRVRATSMLKLDAMIRKYNLEDKRHAAESALKSRVQPDHVILDSVLECAPHLKRFFTRWQKMGMSGYMNSASAIAIAHANVRRATGGKFSTPIDNWLSAGTDFD